MKPEAHLPPAEYAAEHPVLQNPGETRTLDHLPQLDGIRAIAVGMVIWSHFMPDAYKFRGNPPWGAVGVGVFFVLSGFLITRILLNCKLKIADGRSTFSSSIKQFYMRRFLRIFPLYYGAIVVLFILNATNFRSRAIYSVLYLTNYRFSYDRPAMVERAIRGLPHYLSGKVTHFAEWPNIRSVEAHLWSLSVEEQFYIFWPFIVLLCPRKLLVPMIWLTVVIGPVWRTFTYEPGFQKHEWMTPGCLDLLGMGAVLAFLSLPQFGWSKWRDSIVQLCGLFGVPLLIAFMAQRWWPTILAKGKMVGTSFDWMGHGGAVYPITALAAVWFVGTAARGFRGPIGWFLTCPPVVYLGRISYGVYVLHMMVPFAMQSLWPNTFGHGHPRLMWHLWLFAGISVAAASLSWFLYEAPINRLKRYFEYDKRAAAKAETSAAVA